MSNKRQFKALKKLLSMFKKQHGREATMQEFRRLVNGR